MLRHASITLYSPQVMVGDVCAPVQTVHATGTHMQMVSVSERSNIKERHDGTQPPPTLSLLDHVFEPNANGYDAVMPDRVHIMSRAGQCGRALLASAFVLDSPTTSCSDAPTGASAFLVNNNIPKAARYLLTSHSGSRAVQTKISSPKMEQQDRSAHMLTTPTFNGTRSFSVTLKVKQGDFKMNAQPLFDRAPHPGDYVVDLTTATFAKKKSPDLSAGDLDGENLPNERDIFTQLPAGDDSDVCTSPEKHQYVLTETPSTSAGSSRASTPRKEKKARDGRPSTSESSSPTLSLRCLFEGSLTDVQTRTLAERLFFKSMPRENAVEVSVTQLADERSKQRFLRILHDDGNNWSRVRATWHLPGDVQTALAISASGICCDEEHCACGRYGLGGYVALSASKANAYADTDGEGGVRRMFLVLALPDKNIVQGARGTRPECTAADSRSCPTEYCFVDAARLHCACLLSYRWVPTGRRGKVTTAGTRVSHIVPRRSSPEARESRRHTSV